MVRLCCAGIQWNQPKDDGLREKAAGKQQRGPTDKLAHSEAGQAPFQQRTAEPHLLRQGVPGAGKVVVRDDERGSTRPG